MLVELMFTRTNEQLTAAKTAYFCMYDRDLREDIDDDTSGAFGRFLKHVLDGKRRESAYDPEDEESRERIATAATDLHEVVCSEDDGKDDVFIQLLCMVSAEEVEALANEYRTVSDGGELFSDETYGLAGLGEDWFGSDDFKNCVEALGMDKYDYWVKRIKIACEGKRGEELARKEGEEGEEDPSTMAGFAKPREEELDISEEEGGGVLDTFLTWCRGLGTDEDTVSRILASVDKYGALEIARRFDRTYAEPLFEQVYGETSGDYRAALLMWTSTNGLVRDASQLDQASLKSSELDVMDAILITSFLTLSLVSADNELVSANSDGHVSADADGAGPHERFTVHVVAPGIVALQRTDNKTYLEVVDAEGTLSCSSTKLNTNGYWKCIVDGMCISLRNSNNYWLTAWKGELRASGLHPGEYSRFRVFPRPTYRGDLGC